jgi:hypothetical protein
VLVEEASGGSPYAYELLVHHLVATGIDAKRSGEEEVAWLRGQDATSGAASRQPREIAACTPTFIPGKTIFGRRSEPTVPRSSQ